MWYGLNEPGYKIWVDTDKDSYQSRKAENNFVVSRHNQFCTVGRAEIHGYDNPEIIENADNGIYYSYNNQPNLVFCQRA